MNAFKSGMVMMAVKAKVPIVPVFLKKKEHWYSRLVIAIGEPIHIEDYASGPVPTMEDINKISTALEEQTKELEKLAHKERKKKNETSK